MINEKFGSLLQTFPSFTESLAHGVGLLVPGWIEIMFVLYLSFDQNRYQTGNKVEGNFTRELKNMAEIWWVERTSTAKIPRRDYFCT